MVFSPTDLTRFAASPFASWMDRYHLEFPDTITPDPLTDDQSLVIQTGINHEAAVLHEFKASGVSIIEIRAHNQIEARRLTQAALVDQPSMIYQAALELGQFAGYADFLLLNENGHYHVWDTKLARSPKPNYAIQLCCYSEMLAADTYGRMPETFGIILGTNERVEFRVEDFIHYYRALKNRFLALQGSFSGQWEDRPEPRPRDDHGRWTSHAQAYFLETDHLIQVAGISVGQILKLGKEGITTLSDLATGPVTPVPGISTETLTKLIAQAQLQHKTRLNRNDNPKAPPEFEVLPHLGANGEPAGLGLLPAAHSDDVFFDMEGYPLAPGGLEYLFGVWTQDGDKGQFHGWWAHTRTEERKAFEDFIDWVHDRWTKNPDMHVYHYAHYEVSAVRRLSTFHDTRQDKVDDLLRNNVFVDLYQVVKQGLRIGENSYSIKSVEHLYGFERETEVGTAVSSIAHYARWIESGEPGDPRQSGILEAIRAYNEDDCRSTALLTYWLRSTAEGHDIQPRGEFYAPPKEESGSSDRQAIQAKVAQLRSREDEISLVLGNLVDFHRREEKPLHWRMYDRAKQSQEDLRRDAGCIGAISRVGEPRTEKQSLAQAYSFDTDQECKTRVGDTVMFPHRLDAKFTVVAIDPEEGSVEIKIGKRTIDEKLGGEFPLGGSLIPREVVSATPIQAALAAIADSHLGGSLHPPIAALLNRIPPVTPIQDAGESATEAAIRVAQAMSGGCFVIQGPPGTGKTYTAANMIRALLSAGKRVGVSSNSRKAIVNLLTECEIQLRQTKDELIGILVGGDEDEAIFTACPGLQYVKQNSDGFSNYCGGIAAGTAWLFTLPEWEGALDYLFIDEAGQVALANAVAMGRCAKNLVLLGDQMQLEQPVQGSHPGDSGLSALQYALKDTVRSRPDSPVFHAVVPGDYGLFLGESRRMHPSVCRFISDSIYQGRLASHCSCARQSIETTEVDADRLPARHGIVFAGVEHDGNTQKSEEEVDEVIALFEKLIGREFTDKEGRTRPLGLEDFLFIAPYNAQVRAFQSRLPRGAKVGSVDKLQGQQAPVCILSLCSSFGEYGSRGLGFILDKNRLNVAISRAQCLAVIIADPRIATSEAGTLQEMQLLNLFCKIVSS